MAENEEELKSLLMRVKEKSEKDDLKLNTEKTKIMSSSVAHFSSCSQSFQVSGSFLMSSLFTSGVQSIGASVSVLPMNLQD